MRYVSGPPIATIEPAPRPRPCETRPPDSESHKEDHQHPRRTHAWHITGARVVEALHFCTKDRSACNYRGKHPWILDIDSKDGFAIYLFWSVEPLYRCANQLERL